jgi:hypothetical protein
MAHPQVWSGASRLRGQGLAKWFVTMLYEVKAAANITLATFWP